MPPEAPAMNGSALPTLAHLLSSGSLALPQLPARLLFVNALFDLALERSLQGLQVTAIQPDRGMFLAAQGRVSTVSPEPEGDGHDATMMLAGRYRGASELDLAEAVLRTRTGGTVIVAGLKDEGIGSLRKLVAGQVPLLGLSPKHHGLAFWFAVPAEAATLAALLRARNPERLVEGRFHTVPGLFSHEAIDEGSRLLADALPASLSGRAADFGASWGYLSVRLLEQAPGIRSVDLYEADFRALEPARRNLAGATAALAFCWQDLVREPVERRFDVVVCNPPFHSGRAAEPGLGQAFVQAASRALVPGGRLFLVANRQLPYEGVLSQTFARFAERGGNGRFKVIEAIR